MEPSRSDYEIWLIDWLDGTLNQSQVEKLMAFLDKNPDIREEAEFLSLSHLSPAEISMQQKDNLKKSAGELSYSQIEYLSVAYLENDLSTDQQDDLKQNISAHPENKIVFDTLQKIKLSPPHEEYKYKSRLKKRTALQRTMQYSALVLSAAAAILLLVLSITSVPRYLPEKYGRIAENKSDDTTHTETSAVIPERPGDQPAEPVVNISEYVSDEKTAQVFVNVEPDSQAAEIEATDTLAARKTSPVPVVHKIPVHTEVRVYLETRDNVLIASNNNFSVPEYLDDERSRFNKFITRRFREHFLKEDIVNERTSQTL